MMPSVSIIIPVYNGEKTIEATLKSALCQEYDNFEIIIVNDCSKDNSLSIIKTFDDSRIRIIELEKNSGRSVARNRGISESKADYIAMLDADDLLYPQKLKNQMAYIKKNNLKFSGTWAYAIDDKRTKIPYAHPVTDEAIKKSIIKSNAFVHSTVIGEREIFNEFNGYDANLAGPEDYDLYLKITQKYPVGNCPEFLAEYLLPKGLRYIYKEQLNTAKVRLRAIMNYSYSKKYLPFVLTPLVVGIIPRKIKIIIKSFFCSTRK